MSKTISDPIEGKVRPANRPKRIRCYCGSRLVRGKCLVDHDELRKARGAALVKENPLIVSKSEPTCLSVPWTEKKLRLFRKLHSSPIYDRTLDRVISCPSCRTEQPWGAYTFSGCQSRECAEYLG